MGVRRSMRLSARERYYKRRLKRLILLFTTALVIAAVICGNLVYTVFAPGMNSGVSQAIPTFESPTKTKVVVETLTPEPILAESTTEPASTQELPTVTPSAIPFPTEGQIIPASDDSHLLYYTIAGDSLSVVSLHFGVDMDSITSPSPLSQDGLLPPGQLLIIPNRIEETTSKSKLLPDSEVTFSPSTIDFDIEAFVNEAGGYLSTYTQYLASTGTTTGADIIARVAIEYSVNPRLLLAYLEYNAGWVYGTPETEMDLEYPMGYENVVKKDLYLQTAWFASMVMEGYYGWREGRRLVISFPDEQVLRIAPDLNAGTVGLMNVFAYLYEYPTWANLLYGEQSFFTLHEDMFGNAWIRAQDVEPLIPADTLQPEMILPFEVGALWAFTGGPHAAWSAADVWAAIDFAPASAETGCHESNAWVLATIPGLIVRSGNGVVVIDMDGDGYEQTGWTMLYLHIATKDRIPLGTWVEVGDRIGHASCEGGRSTGTHVHLARRYNGEWVPADGPLPFTLDGWVAKAGTEAYKGWLLRGDEIIHANTAATQESQIRREN